MATVILVGGSEKEAPTHFGERLAREVSVRFERPPQILSCQFAKGDVAEQRASAVQWATFFATHFPESQVQLASQEQFYQQVEAADMIYLHGGKTETLFAALPDLNRSRQAFRDKLVIGTSAGANYLAAAGYSPKGGEFYEGCGMAPVSVLVHYGATSFLSAGQWRDVARRMQVAYGRDVVCLSEGEYIAMEVDDDKSANNPA